MKAVGGMSRSCHQVGNHSGAVEINSNTECSCYLRVLEVRLLDGRSHGIQEVEVEGLGYQFRGGSWSDSPAYQFHRLDAIGLPVLIALVFRVCTQAKMASSSVLESQIIWGIGLLLFLGHWRQDEVLVNCKSGI